MTLNAPINDHLTEGNSGNAMRLSDMLQIPTLSPYVSPFQIAPFGFDGEGDQGGNGGASDQGGNGGQGAGQGAGQGQGNQGTGNGKADNGSESDDDDDDEYKGLTPSQLKAKLKEQSDARKAAEKTAADHQAEIDKANRAKNDELTNTKGDLAKAQEENETLKATNSHLALVNAILNTTDYSWHNAEIVAQQVISAGGVEVDPATGKVEGLKKVLKKVAEDHAYLLKTDTNNGGQQGNNGQGGGFIARPTGIQPGQGGANNGGQGQGADKDELAKAYPALIGRR